MEYQKESEKFAFGFGTEKIAGKGKLSGAEKVSEKSVKQEIAEIVLSIIAVAGTVFFKVRADRKKKKSSAKKGERR